MQSFPPTVILRHRKENLKKCSLRGLESRSDFRFYPYPTDPIPLLPNYIILALDAPVLSEADRDKGLLIVDATWRYAGKMMQPILANQPFIKRSLPPELRTAYPRRQEDCPDPERGLASLGAIYAAYFLLGRDIKGLLDNYYWKKQFLEINNLESLKEKIYNC